MQNISVIVKVITGKLIHEAPLIDIISPYYYRTLAVLRDVLGCVAKKKPRMKLQSQHIPYRNSKLTLFLQDYLQLGLCKIILMTHISSDPNQMVESSNSLSYARHITATIE